MHSLDSFTSCECLLARLVVRAARGRPYWVGASVRPGNRNGSRVRTGTPAATSSGTAAGCRCWQLGSARRVQHLFRVLAARAQRSLTQLSAARHRVLSIGIAFTGHGCNPSLSALLCVRSVGCCFRHWPRCPT